MKYSWIFRIMGVVLLVIGIAAVAYAAYNAGAAQGQTAVTAGENAVQPVFRGWHSLAGLAFLPLLLCLGPLFLCLFVFLPLRMIFGPRPIHPHRYWRWREGEGYMPPFFGFWHARCRDGEDAVPPPFEEWHRRMHETEKKSD
jgi:hypothetical protein